MKRFADYHGDAHQWITTFASDFYPDILDSARTLYTPVQMRFLELIMEEEDSTDLLRRIQNEPSSLRVELLRVFRRYVSPTTSVEMLKAKGKTETTISAFSRSFRSLGEVQERLTSRPIPDDALSALLYEHHDRGAKGYELTNAFFVWFESKYGETGYSIEGPRGAGADIILSKILPDFEVAVPADFVIRSSGDIVAVGFARYDSDRGGAQEDDRVGGNVRRARELLEYADRKGLRSLRVVFLNDGPGLLLGSMWRDYAAMEDLGPGVLVTTLKMLDERLTLGWLRGERR